METSVQFADVFRSKIVRRENAYLEGRTKRVFNDRFTVNIQRAVWIFRDHEQDKDLSETAQHSDTLLKEIRQVPILAMAPV